MKNKKNLKNNKLNLPIELIGEIIKTTNTRQVEWM